MGLVIFGERSAITVLMGLLFACTCFGDGTSEAYLELLAGVLPSAAICIDEAGRTPCGRGR
jgi:hypothetical protein